MTCRPVSRALWEGVLMGFVIFFDYPKRCKGWNLCALPPKTLESALDVWVGSA